MMTFKKSRSNAIVIGFVALAALQLVAADTISVLESCVRPGDAIEITFTKEMDGNFIDNWIAIYPSDRLSNLESLPSGVMWAWLCGTQGCSSETNPPAGSIVFAGSSLGWLSTSWPLQPGSYNAVLTRGQDGQNWPALVVSESFTVGNCGVAPSLGPEMTSVIRDARRDIERLIESDPLLIGKFLRLAFHDCVGGCDGCVDMSNDDNAGLVLPIVQLRPIADEYESLGLTRTDIWMLSAVVASEVSDTVRGIGFPFQWFGRKTCEQVHGDDCGLDANGEPASCGPFTGPHRAICHGDTAGTSTIQQFMLDEFGFDAQQTAAIMGAHTVGAMRDVNLGFEGRSGWDLTNDVLDHGYFIELVGDEGTDVPEWEQVLHNNNDLDGIPSRWQYEVRVDGTRLTMLNSDIALVRNLVEGENLESDGRITCDFVGGNNECDRNTPFMPFMERYADDIDDFLEDYREALNLMIDNGYARDSRCQNNDACELRSLS